MEGIELVGKRKRREKHFLKKNGEITAMIYDEDIHFKKNGKYEEIDNTLVLQNNQYVNKNNDYKVIFTTNRDNDLMKIEKLNHYIDVKLKDGKNVELVKGEHSSKLFDNIKYCDVFKNIDLEYQVMPTKVKECIILKDKDAEIDKLVFSVNTDLELVLNGNKSINAMKDGKVLFTIDVPYMIDSNNQRNNNINYILEQGKDNYLLKMNIDKSWLNDINTVYPVIIDPTITNTGSSSSVYDTYIYPNDTNDDRASKSYLKAGVERINGKDVINRVLLKFELPKIGTGSQIINAELNLYGYPDYSNSYASDIVSIHRITSDWNESTANWSNMNNKYDATRIEGAFDSSRRFYTMEDGTVKLSLNGAEITNLVKKWYTDTPNYGIMLKANTESYTNAVIPMFFSKNNVVGGGNPKPFLAITYRNQNGLEDYMSYQSQSFSQGTAYSNNYNGNVTTIFNIGKTIGGKQPIGLNLVYNTNDVILNNNIGYGLGYRLNLSQTIKGVTIDGINYLEYIDEDGTIHYFLNQKTRYDEKDGYITTTYENTYYDEDGLDLIIMNNNDDYILIDKNDNKMKFIKNNGIGYLSEIKDVGGNLNTITYDSSNKITKIVDANNQEINITYENDRVSVTSSDQTVTLNYLNDQVTSIVGLLGTTSFLYNSNHALSSITDVTGLQTVYEYYEEVPYRLKKISEYGLEKSLGNYMDISYGFNSTTITDTKGHLKNIIFNNSGTVKSTSILKEKDDITNAYGIKETTGETLNGVTTTTNKLLDKQIPLKYVKNFLSNSSFETDDLKFSSTNDKVNLTLSTEEFTTGFRSLKAVNDESGQKFATTISLPKNNYYTFSAYIKNNNNIRLSLSYLEEYNHTEEVISEIVSNTNEFERQDITIYYPDTAISDLLIKFYVDTPGTAYIDDLQLEIGEVANNYNLLENSDFSNGLSDWILSCSAHNTGTELSTSDKFEIVDINDQTKALKVRMNPAYNTTFSQKFNVRGKGGDTYNISFWYKNEGFVGVTGIGSPIYNNVIVNFHSVDEGDGHCIYPSESFNPNDNEWQYFSSSFVAEKDFDSVTLTFMQGFMANNFYITNLNLFKDVRSVSYDYDERGNVIMSKDLNNQSNKFDYDANNQLIKMTEPQGKSFVYEYDNDITSRVLKSISESGISNEIKYDKFGNPVVTRIINRGKDKNLSDDLYKIRLKGTNKILRLINNEIKIVLDECGHDKWKLEKVELDGKEYYKISHSIINNKYITIDNNNIVLSNGSTDNSLFILTKNDNGSYLIKSKINNMYLNNTNDLLVLSDLQKDSPNYEFYFESNRDDLFIENSAEYTDDGRFVVSTTDTNLNKIIYDVDNDTGLIKSVLNPKGNMTSYNYNNKKQLISIYNGNKFVNYEYNNQNLLYKIIQGSREYFIGYDEFLNVNSIKIGDKNTIVTYLYEENNGGLKSLRYGNDNIILFDYDEFNRIKTMTTMDNVYHYKYGNNGDLLKIISNDNETKYEYDLGKRLYRYSFDEFYAKYIYDANDNIVNKEYMLGDVNEKIYNIFNSSNQLSKIVINNEEINYNYDSLGRISNISGINSIDYKYVTNGKRTSYLTKSIIIGNNQYMYQYDKLDNITHVYHNNNLENQYYYDEYNQLIKENNYLTNETIQYMYDELGNILTKTVFELNSSNRLYINTYEYSNLEWPDQLTKFNDDIITYDSIGNPVTIGNNIILGWNNGNQLSSYNYSNNTINYKYNKDGIRLSKTINDKETKYYLEENNIIFEKTDDNVVYYLYDNDDDIIGFRYHNNSYYYIKNNQNDVIEIVDNNNHLIAKYFYDSFGKILSITDKNNNDVSFDNNHIANINPFRYRSYYYDRETGFYYLNNRYYNPKWGRFISIDNIINENKDILGNNLYIYCSNNYINYCDPDGHGLISTLWNGLKSLFSKKSKKKSKKKSSKKPKTTTKQSAKKVSTPSNGHGNVPRTGIPNSSVRKPNGDWRTYGPDGRAVTDTDFNHPQRHPELENPHFHDWNWNGDESERGPAYGTPKVDKIAKVALTAGAGYIIYRGIRMLPSLLPPNWWTIPFNVATP